MEQQRTSSLPSFLCFLPSLPSPLTLLPPTHADDHEGSAGEPAGPRCAQTGQAADLGCAQDAGADEGGAHDLMREEEQNGGREEGVMGDRSAHLECATATNTLSDSVLWLMTVIGSCKYCSTDWQAASGQTMLLTAFTNLFSMLLLDRVQELTLTYRVRVCGKI